MLALRGARLAAAAAPRGGALQRAAAAPRCSLSTTTGKAWEPPKAKVAPSSKRLDAISASIFGTLPSTNVRSGNKVLRKKLKGPLLADYYFDQSGVDIDVVGREILSGWMNDREARRKNQLEILRRRGKGPPKKGMGKRSESGCPPTPVAMATLHQIIPPLPSTERGRTTQIYTDKNGGRMVYCNGTNVVLRSWPGEGETFIYKEHAVQVIVAAVSPNGEWVASGDVGGQVRVWGTKGEHSTKGQYQPWSGPVYDICWDSENKRIAICGEGREIRGAVIMWDTGSKLGEISGHSTRVYSCSFKPSRPFRVATGGEDKLGFHEGPPFKFKLSQNVHTNFINSVRFSPSGDLLLSAGSDTKIVVYDGKEGEVVREFTKADGMSGSIWSAAWSPDSAQVATVGGDKHLRLWDPTAGTQVAKGTLGSALEDMLVGVCWPAANPVSVALDGRVTVWDAAGEVVDTIDGNQGQVSDLTYDEPSRRFVLGSNDGCVCSGTADGPRLQRSKLGKMVQHTLGRWDASVGPGVVVASMDDKLRIMDPATGALSDGIAVGEFMVGLAWLAPDVVVTATSKGNLIAVNVASSAILWTKPLPRAPTGVGASVNGGFIAVAYEMEGPGKELRQIELFTCAEVANGDSVVSKGMLEKHKADVVKLRFTGLRNDRKNLLATSDSVGKIFIWDTETMQLVEQGWSFHTARVSTLEWNPDQIHLVSGSLDRSVIVWNLADPGKRIKIDDVHKGGVTGVCWSSPTQVASSGADGCFIVHDIAL